MQIIDVKNKDDGTKVVLCVDKEKYYVLDVTHKKFLNQGKLFKDSKKFEKFNLSFLEFAWTIPWGILIGTGINFVAFDLSTYLKINSYAENFDCSVSDKELIEQIQSVLDANSYLDNVDVYYSLHALDDLVYDYKEYLTKTQYKQFLKACYTVDIEYMTPIKGSDTVITGFYSKIGNVISTISGDEKTLLHEFIHASETKQYRKSVPTLVREMRASLYSNEITSYEEFNAFFRVLGELIGQEELLQVLNSEDENALEECLNECFPTYGDVIRQMLDALEQSFSERYSNEEMNVDKYAFLKKVAWKNYQTLYHSKFQKYPSEDLIVSFFENIFLHDLELSISNDYFYGDSFVLMDDQVIISSDQRDGNVNAYCIEWLYQNDDNFRNFYDYYGYILGFEEEEEYVKLLKIWRYESYKNHYSYSLNR